MAHVSQLYIRGSEMTAVNRHYFLYKYISYGRRCIVYSYINSRKTQCFMSVIIIWVCMVLVSSEKRLRNATLMMVLMYIDTFWYRKIHTALGQMVKFEKWKPMFWMSYEMTIKFNVILLPRNIIIQLTRLWRVDFIFEPSKWGMVCC